VILVVDASVTIAWIAQDERNAYADSALAACGSDRAVVPGLWRWEIANTLIVLERRGRLQDAGQIYSSLLRTIPMNVESDAVTESRALSEIEHARRHGLSVYDAAYLALAKSEGLPLATLDAKLARAAQSEGVLFGSLPR
jgi:predicted nucleic acid-binding protein